MMDNKINILLIDDEDIIHKVTNLSLDKNLFNVISAYNDEEARKLIKQFSDILDLILLDLYVGKVKGEDIYKAIREIPNLKIIPIIFQTGQSNIPDISDDMTWTLLKPYNIKQLMNIMEVIPKLHDKINKTPPNH